MSPCAGMMIQGRMLFSLRPLARLRRLRFPPPTKGEFAKRRTVRPFARRGPTEWASREVTLGRNSVVYSIGGFIRGVVPRPSHLCWDIEGAFGLRDYDGPTRWETTRKARTTSKTVRSHRNSIAVSLARPDDAFNSDLSSDVNTRRKSVGSSLR